MTGLRSLPATQRQAQEQQRDSTAASQQNQRHAATSLSHVQPLQRDEPRTAASQPHQTASSNTPEADSCTEACGERSHGPRSLCMQALSQPHTDQQQCVLPFRRPAPPAHEHRQPPFGHSTLPIHSGTHSQSTQCHSAPQEQLSWAEERAVGGGKAIHAAAGPVSCDTATRAGSSVGRNHSVAPVFFSPLPFSYLNVAKSLSTDQLLQQEHSQHSPDVTLRAGRLTVSGCCCCFVVPHQAKRPCIRASMHARTLPVELYTPSGLLGIPWPASSVGCQHYFHS